DIITDDGKQMERWTEQYQQLYSQENIVTDIAVESINQLPVMGELDDPPSLEELSKAINTLANSKATDSDGIPPEVIKAGKKTVPTPASVLDGRTCKTALSQSCIRTRETAVTVTTTAVSPCSASSARSSHAWPS
ncbi:hypothetical protein AC249_AIPGENE27459, partial [Exaiptasia diaphana]